LPEWFIVDSIGFNYGEPGFLREYRIIRYLKYHVRGLWLEILDKFKKALDEQLCIITPPVAIKFLEKMQDIPGNMGRPLRELGERIRPCETWHYARHFRFPVALLEEDCTTACPIGMFVCGLAEPLRGWLDGDLAYKTYAGSREAAVNMEKNVFRLDARKYKGIAAAPLDRANFTPDLVMVYCNSAQAARLVAAAEWRTGEPLRVSMAARALCSDGVVQPFQTGRPVLAIPCGGDRDHGRTQDDELVFTIPFGRVEEIIEGWEGYEKTHSAVNLGEANEQRKRYNAMAKVLDKKLGR